VAVDAGRVRLPRSAELGIVRLGLERASDKKGDALCVALAMLELLAISMPLQLSRA
jgi:hypothetical protein